MNDEEMAVVKQIEELASKLLPRSETTRIDVFDSKLPGAQGIHINDEAEINVIKFYRGKIVQSKNVVVVDLSGHVPSMNIRNEYRNGVAFTHLCNVMNPGIEIKASYVKELLKNITNDFSNSDIVVIVWYYNAWYQWHNVHNPILYEIDTDL